ncbi:MAG: hypothetical protein U1E22_10295 [Coriobacteriia bacterium]|nr:hypothetical protein [Coriobacteriia bacterium]
MSTDDTLFTALGTVLTLQRWNVLPRIETWVEAENAVYVAHVGYVLGRTKGLSNEELLRMMERVLFKSLNVECHDIVDGLSCHDIVDTRSLNVTSSRIPRSGTC